MRSPSTTLRGDSSTRFGPNLLMRCRAGDRFACITHSTGGPVVRHWWYRFYQRPSSPPPCPVSHLIMLAPADFGSALAQLGKSRLSRIKTWFEGVEPGTAVLDWLELGSPEAWELNRAWIRLRKDFSATNGVFPFVLTGQTIDRSLYDHVNAYTGEPGSDGVVRVAAANLNATYDPDWSRERTMAQAHGSYLTASATLQRPRSRSWPDAHTRERRSVF